MHECKLSNVQQKINIILDKLLQKYTLFNHKIIYLKEIVFCEKRKK